MPFKSQSPELSHRPQTEKNRRFMVEWSFDLRLPSFVSSVLFEQLFRIVFPDATIKQIACQICNGCEKQEFSSRRSPIRETHRAQETLKVERLPSARVDDRAPSAITCINVDQTATRECWPIKLRGYSAHLINKDSSSTHRVNRPCRASECRRF